MSRLPSNGMIRTPVGNIPNLEEPWHMGRLEPGMVDAEGLKECSRLESKDTVQGETLVRQECVSMGETYTHCNVVSLA